MVLTLVGVSRGMLEDQAARSKGVGADLVIRAPGSSIIGLSTNFPAGVLDVVRKMPHVAVATGTLVQGIGYVNTVTGIDLASFTKMSGGFQYLEGGPFQNHFDLIVDDVYARSNNLHAGSFVEMLGQNWRVAGVVQSGKLSRMFVRLPVLQELASNSNKLTAIYVKLDNPSLIASVTAELKKRLPDYKIYSMEDLISLFSASNIPMLQTFIRVVIGISVLVGFLVVFLSMYTAVLERTREIGILKALGASPAYILNILLRETVVLALGGSVLGVIFTYGTRWLMATLVPTMTQVIVPDWWPIAAGISLVGALFGAFYPGLKAARQDAIEALAYE